MMKRTNKKERRGLPGGPHEQFTYVTGVFQQDMYHLPKAQEGIKPWSSNYRSSGDAIGMMDWKGDSKDILNDNVSVRSAYENYHEVVKQQKQEAKDYINSPGFLRIAARSYDNPKAEQKARLKRVSSVPYKLVDKIGSKRGMINGMYLPDTHNIELEYWGYKGIPLEEFNHSSVYGRMSDRENIGIEKSMRAITDRDSSWDWDINPTTGNKYYYGSDPIEVQNRLMMLRKAAKEAGLYDYNKEDFTKDHLLKLKESIKKNPDKYDYQQINSLFKNVKSDNDLIWLMNNIAYNNTKGLSIGKYGGKVSTEGYKRNSPDVNNPFNVIPSGDITMKDVDFPVHGIDNLGNQQMMYPGGEYQFPGDMVYETPIAQDGREIPIAQDGRGFFDPYSTESFTDMELAIGWQEYLNPSINASESTRLEPITIPSNEYINSVSDFNISKRFHKDWMNSPMHMQMLKKSAGDNYLKILKGRNQNIDDATLHNRFIKGDQYIPGSLFSGKPAGGYAQGLKYYNQSPLYESLIERNKAGRHVQRYNEHYSNLPTHELSHIQDYNKSFIGLLLGDIRNKYDYYHTNFPKSDINFIRNLKIKDTKLSKESEEYYSDPTEVRARLNEIRHSAMRNKTWDPFNEKMTPKQLDWLNFHFMKPSALDDLQQIYTDEQIIDLLNTISQTEDDSNISIAQQGREIPRAQDGIPKSGYSIEDYLSRVITPIGYDVGHALKEIEAGKRLPFTWHGEKTSFEDFDKMDRWKELETGELGSYGQYVKETSKNAFDKYLKPKENKFEHISPSQYRPTKNAGENIEYMQFNIDDDIWDTAKGANILDAKVGTNKQIINSADGGFALKDYTLSRGKDDKGNYISYWDRNDYSPTVMGVRVPLEKLVGKPYDFYGRMYFDPKTGERISPKDIPTQQNIDTRYESKAFRQEGGEKTSSSKPKHISKIIELTKSLPSYQSKGETTEGLKEQQQEYISSIPFNEKDKILTYQNNPEYFDNKAALHSNTKYSDIIRSKVYAGTHGFNPTTGVLTKLDSPQGGAKGLDLAYSKREEDRTSQDKRQVQHAKTFKDLQALYKNPLFYAPAAVATAGALGPAIGAGVAKTLANPYVQAGLTGLGIYDATTSSIPGAFTATKEGRYLDAAGNIGMASLDLLPIPFFGTNLAKEYKNLRYLKPNKSTPLPKGYQTRLDNLISQRKEHDMLNKQYTAETFDARNSERIRATLDAGIEFPRDIRIHKQRMLWEDFNKTPEMVEYNKKFNKAFEDKFNMPYSEYRNNQNIYKYKAGLYNYNDPKKYYRYEKDANLLNEIKAFEKTNWKNQPDYKKWEKENYPGFMFPDEMDAIRKNLIDREYQKMLEDARKSKHELTLPALDKQFRDNPKWRGYYGHGNIPVHPRDIEKKARTRIQDLSTPKLSNEQKGVIEHEKRHQISTVQDDLNHRLVLNPLRSKGNIAVKEMMNDAGVWTTPFDDINRAHNNLFKDMGFKSMDDIKQLVGEKGRNRVIDYNKYLTQKSDEPFAQWKGIKRRAVETPGIPFDDINKDVDLDMLKKFEIYDIDEGSNFLKRINPEKRQEWLNFMNKYGWSTTGAAGTAGMLNQQEYAKGGELDKYQGKGEYDIQNKDFRNDVISPIEVTPESSYAHKYLDKSKQFLTDWYSSDMAKSMLTESYEKQYEGTPLSNAEEAASSNLKERIANINALNTLKRLPPTHGSKGFIKASPIDLLSKKPSTIGDTINIGVDLTQSFLKNSIYHPLQKFIKENRGPKQYRFDPDVGTPFQRMLKSDGTQNFMEDLQSAWITLNYYAENPIYPRDEYDLKMLNTLRRDLAKFPYNQMMQNTDENSVFNVRDGRKNESTNYSGFYDKFTDPKFKKNRSELPERYNTIFYNKNYKKELPNTMLHELGHISTDGNVLIPNEDIRTIQEELPSNYGTKFKPEQLKKIVRPGFKDAYGNSLMQSKDDNQKKLFQSLPYGYFDNPAEVQTRLNIARFHGKNFGWDAMKRKATKKDVEQLKKSKNHNIQELFKNYSPEHILKMLNTVAYQNNDEYLNTVQQGGSTDKKWMQKASKSMEKRGTKGSLTRTAKAAGYSSPKAYCESRGWKGKKCGFLKGVLSSQGKMQEGGQIQDKFEIYKNYINGTCKECENEAVKVYDKLNRIYYKDAKQVNMSPPNYIMTHIIGNA